MSANEIYTLARVFCNLGVTKIRLTGGEPTVRKDFPQIVNSLASLPAELTLTTNGSLVHNHLDILKSAGIRSVNVSLDTMQREAFLTITRRDALDKVWSNIMLLLESGMRVKVNVVAMPRTLNQDLFDFVELTRSFPLHVRFIEFMPFAGNRWDKSMVVPAAALLESVSNHYDIVKLMDEPNSTARKYKVIGATGTFAFITTMSDSFCSSCNRLRITADGKLKNCLFGAEEFDLLTAIRQGSDPHHLILQSVQNKHAALGGQMPSDYTHADTERIVNRSMVRIGG